MIKIFEPLFTPPTLQTLVVRELYQTERDLLEAISSCENWKSRAQILEERSRRLRSELEGIMEPPQPPSIRPQAQALAVASGVVLAAALVIAVIRYIVLLSSAS